MAMRLGRFICGCVREVGLCSCSGDLGADRVGPARPRSDALPAAASLDQLLRMSPAELEAIYRQGTAVAIPAGPIRGTALLSPGTRRRGPVARRAAVWQGKVIEPGRATAVNRFFGLRMVRGQVVSGPELARRPGRRWCSTTARHHASTPTIATRSVRSPRACSWA